MSISSESDLHRNRRNVRRERRRARKTPSLKFTSVSERGSKIHGEKKCKKKKNAKLICLHIPVACKRSEKKRTSFDLHRSPSRRRRRLGCCYSRRVNSRATCLFVFFQKLKFVISRKFERIKNLQFARAQAAAFARLRARVGMRFSVRVRV